eukprot:TRINITY_DN2461_c0_g1_i10.p1 TRINITY_DN2461_c0_g1~~TRINITY_DN2461_c0_g1_i10.p1  ORF type:complete len:592 (-),score=87.73 TRINITY_DN2461_c0_g1_i10:37-1812(-)
MTYLQVGPTWYVFLRTYNFPHKQKESAVANSNRIINFVIALKQHNLELLERLFWNVSDPTSSSYRKFMSTEEILSIVAPSKRISDEVARWLVPAKAEFRGDAIWVECSVSHASWLFHTQFGVFLHESGHYIVRQVGAYSIPSNLADKIDFITGLSDFPVMKFTRKRGHNTLLRNQKRYILTGPQPLVSISPQSVWNIYQTQGAKVRGDSSVAVVEMDNHYYSTSDLSTFAGLFHLHISPVARIIGSNQPNEESNLDATMSLQSVLSTAVKAVGWYWREDSNLGLYGFASNLFSRPDVPNVVALSNGWNEEIKCQNEGRVECNLFGIGYHKYIKRVNIEFQKIGLRGITLICASGDSGANGRTDRTCSNSRFNPIFPASSPYVTTVGATQISEGSGTAQFFLPPQGCERRSCASSGVEESVSYHQSGFSSGGGFSDLSPLPVYQSEAVAAYLNSGQELPPESYFNRTGRGYPDVATLGSNILVVKNGEVVPVSGTSSSLSIFTGILVLLNDYVKLNTGKPLGFVSPLLYKMAVNRPSAFTDVTTGDNKCTESGCHENCKGFKASEGWDPVSGLGTPVYPEMLAFIKSHVLKQ